MNSWFFFLVFPAILFSSNGVIGSTSNNAIDGEGIVNGAKSTIPVRGMDTSGSSQITFGKLIPFSKGTNVVLNARGLNYVDNQYENNIITVMLLTSEAKSIFLTRIPLPFHTLSAISTTPDNTKVNVKFNSGGGYQKSGIFGECNKWIAYLVIKFPSSTPMPAAAQSICSSVSGLTLVNGFGSGYTCSISNNELTINSIGGEYPTSNSTNIEFSIAANSAFTVADTDYIQVLVKEGIKDRVIETAVVFFQLE